MKNYVNEVVEYATPYYQNNDNGHQIDHAISVLDNALQFKRKLNLVIPDREIVAAAIMHDIQLYLGRTDHHYNGWLFVSKADYPGRTSFSTSAGERIELAVFQHRASYDGAFTSELSSLISSADRGIPSTIKELLDRMLICKTDWARRHNKLLSSDEIMVESVNHLKEKFGSCGYSRYPDIYRKMFNNQLTTRAKLIDAL